MLGKSICAFAVFVVWCTGVLLGYFFSFSFYQREEETVLKYVVYGLFTVVHISHNTNIFSSLVYLKKKNKILVWMNLTFKVWNLLLFNYPLLLCSLHLWAKIWVCLFVFWEDQATWKEYWINTWLSPFLSVLSVISGFFLQFLTLLWDF